MSRNTSTSQKRRRYTAETSDPGSGFEDNAVSPTPISGAKHASSFVESGADPIVRMSTQKIREELDNFKTDLERRLGGTWIVSSAVDAIYQDARENPETYKPQAKEGSKRFSKRLAEKAEDMKANVYPSWPTRGDEHILTGFKICQNYIKEFHGVEHPELSSVLEKELIREIRKSPGDYRRKEGETLEGYSERMYRALKDYRSKLRHTRRDEQVEVTRKDLTDALVDYHALLQNQSKGLLNEDKVADVFELLTENIRLLPSEYKKGPGETEDEYIDRKGRQLELYMDKLRQSISRPTDVDSTRTYIKDELFRYQAQLLMAKDSSLTKDGLRDAITMLDGESGNRLSWYRRKHGESEVRFESRRVKKLDDFKAMLGILGTRTTEDYEVQTIATIKSFVERLWQFHTELESRQDSAASRTPDGLDFALEDLGFDYSGSPYMYQKEEDETNEQFQHRIADRLRTFTAMMGSTLK